MMQSLNTAKGPVARVTDMTLLIKDGSTFLEALYSTDCEVVVFAKALEEGVRLLK